jgi:hypothetical protein
VIRHGVDLAKLSLADFVAVLASEHPELRQPIAFPDVFSIALRENLPIRVMPLSRPARLLRLGEHVVIQINSREPSRQWATYGMHELCHYWRDDAGELCYHADVAWRESPSEDFAETFAWHVTQNPRITLARGFLDGDGSFSVKVAGTSYRQKSLERIAGERGWHAIETDVVATIVLENGNPHDANAVRVEIFGLQVGYLPRELALAYRRMLRTSERAAIAETCLARITGGWQRGGGDCGHYGVRLDLILPDLS